jgi:pyruvate carboxylase subunit B
VKYIVTVAGREIEVEVDGERVTVAGRIMAAALRRVPGTPLRQLSVDGRPETLVMQPSGRGQWAIGVRGERWEVEVVDERTRHIRSLTGGADRPRGPGALRAPMPGLVVRVLVEPGQSVSRGGGVVVLEAMKMENELKAPAAGVVGAIRVGAGEPVEKGQVLVELRERTAGADASP